MGRASSWERGKWLSRMNSLTRLRSHQLSANVGQEQHGDVCSWLSAREELETSWDASSCVSHISTQGLVSISGRSWANDIQLLPMPEECCWGFEPIHGLCSSPLLPLLLLLPFPREWDAATAPIAHPAHLRHPHHLR